MPFSEEISDEIFSEEISEEIFSEDYKMKTEHLTEWSFPPGKEYCLTRMVMTGQLVVRKSRQCHSREWVIDWASLVIN